MSSRDPVSSCDPDGSFGCSEAGTEAGDTCRVGEANGLASSRNTALSRGLVSLATTQCLELWPRVEPRPGTQHRAVTRCRAFTWYRAMARNGSFGCSEAETEAGDTCRVGEDNYIGLFGGALEIALEEGALEEAS